MSSQTSEHYGAIGIIVMVIILTIKYGIPDGTHIIDIWMDNAEVLRRSGITRTDALKLSDYDVKDYSLWRLMNDMVTLTVLTITLRFNKVKSHQDSNNNGEPLLLSEELNVRVDQIAAHIRQYEGPVQPGYFNDYEGIVITTNDQIPGRSIFDITLHQIGGAQLKQYLLTKHKWDISTLSLINWQGLEYSLDISDHIKRLNYTQLIHDWQNDGQQKYLFETTKRQQQRTT